MAEQSTDLTVTGGGLDNQIIASSDLDAARKNTDQEERSSSKFDLAIGDLDLLRQIILVISIAICVALIIMLFSWVQKPEMRPLGAYQTEELIPVLDYLDQQKIHYTLDGNTVSVEASKYNNIKLSMVRSGINQPTDAGADILLQDMGFGVSQTLEQERLKLSRERQLAQAIEDMKQVRKARVLLALPKQSMFVRHSQEASASVFLTLTTGVNLKQQEIDSIVDMVASAVPGMKTSKITVTDQHGRLLSSGSQDLASVTRRKEQEIEQEQEQLLREKIDSVLIPILGIGNYTAQVDVQMNFNAIEQTRRQFDPNNSAIRSEYQLEDRNNSGMTAGIPGALSNQPPADASIPEDILQLKDSSATGFGNSRSESTRNFEVDTTIYHERKQTGVIDRQTVSVAVKELRSVNNETGDVTYSPISDEKLEAIRQVLIGAIGFTEARGDLLNVLSVNFAEPMAEDIPNPAIWEHENFNDWVRWFASALVIIVILLVLVRPAMIKLLNPTKSGDDILYDANGLPIGGDTTLLTSDIDNSAQELFEFSSSIDLPNLHKDEDVLKAVRALVANEPELAAQVIKHWVAETNG